MTAWNHTVTLHNFQTHFNFRLRSWLVLNFLFHSGVKWTSNINNQALLFHFIQYRLVVFNLVVSLYFEVPQQLVVYIVDSYTGCGSWLLLHCSGFLHVQWLWLIYNTCICHPCHNPAFHIQNKSHWIIFTILSSLQHRFCFWASFLHFNTIWLTASSLSLPFYTLQAHDDFACQLSL